MREQLKHFFVQHILRRPLEEEELCLDASSSEEDIDEPRPVMDLQQGLMVSMDQGAQALKTFIILHQDQLDISQNDHEALRKALHLNDASLVLSLLQHANADPCFNHYAPLKLVIVYPDPQVDEWLNDLLSRNEIHFPLYVIQDVLSQCDIYRQILLLSLNTTCTTEIEWTLYQHAIVDVYIQAELSDMKEFSQKMVELWQKKAPERFDSFYCRALKQAIPLKLYTTVATCLSVVKRNRDLFVEAYDLAEPQDDRMISLLRSVYPRKMLYQDCHKAGDRHGCSVLVDHQLDRAQEHIKRVFAQKTRS